MPHIPLGCQVMGSPFFSFKTSVADPGCLSRIRIFSIPYPGVKKIRGSWIRIRIKEFKYFTQKIVSTVISRKYDPGRSFKED